MAQVGYVEEIYYDADGDIASPTWVLMPGVQDVQESSTKNKAEIAERNNAVQGVYPTHTVYSVDVTLTKNVGDTDYDALRAAYEDNTKIGVAVMSGPVATVGSAGFQAEAYITSWSSDGSHEGSGATITIEAAADPTTAADYVTVSV